MNKYFKTLELNKIIIKLTEFASTTYGRELCEKVSPSFEIEEIKERLSETDEATKMILQFGTPAFSSIHDIRTAIKRAEINSVLSPEELLNIADTLRGSKALKKYYSQCEENLPILSEIFENLYSNPSIEDSIYHAIDTVDHISDRASSELFKIRTQIKSEESKIQEKLNSIIRGNSYSKYLQNCQF